MSLVPSIHSESYQRYRPARYLMVRMLKGLAALAPSHLPNSAPSTHLPKSLRIPLIQQSSEHILPTHVLAIRSSASPRTEAAQAGGDQYNLFPIHSILLATYCSKFPALPSSDEDDEVFKILELPLIPFSLPSVSAFPVLLEFMYNPTADSVLQRLFRGGIPPSERDPLLVHERDALILVLTEELHSRSNGEISFLWEHVHRVWELWRDVCALGMTDETLWDAINIAWDSILGALRSAEADDDASLRLPQLPMI